MNFSPEGFIIFVLMMVLFIALLVGLYHYFKAMILSILFTIKVLKCRNPETPKWRIILLSPILIVIPIVNNVYYKVMEDTYENMMKEKERRLRYDFVFESLFDIENYLKLDNDYREKLLNMMTLVKLMEYNVVMKIAKDHIDPSNASERVHQLYIKIIRERNNNIIFTSNFEVSGHFEPKPIQMVKHQLNIDELYMSSPDFKFMINLIEQRL